MSRNSFVSKKSFIPNDIVNKFADLNASSKNEYFPFASVLKLLKNASFFDLPLICVF